MADPRPAFSPGTAAMTASVEGTSAAPMPSPMSSRAAPTSQYDVCGPTRERAANSSAPPPRAAATVRVVPIRRNRRPAWRGVYPWTNCRYWVSRNASPPMASPARVIATVPHARRGFRNSRRSSIGSRARASCRTKVAPASTARPSEPITAALIHQLEGASMIPETREVKATTERASPGRSGRGGAGCRLSGTRIQPPARAAIAIGTFSRNTDPHQKFSRSHPPTMGPRGMPRLAIPVQSPMALTRSPRAEAVPERPHGEQEPGEDHDVGIEDPLQRRRRRAQFPLQRRHGDVDDRVVDDDDQQAHREDRQGPPAAPVGVPSPGSMLFVGAHFGPLQCHSPAGTAALVVVRGHWGSPPPASSFRTAPRYRVAMPYWIHSLYRT